MALSIATNSLSLLSSETTFTLNCGIVLLSAISILASITSARLLISDISAHTISAFPVPEIFSILEKSENDNIIAELITTSDTFEKSAAFVRTSTVPSEIVKTPPPRSIELPLARIKVSLSSAPKSRVRLPPSRSTLISAVSTKEPVPSGIVITTSPAPVIALVALNAAACVRDSPSVAPVETTKVAALRSAPAANVTTSDVDVASPLTVTVASPKCELAPNSTVVDASIAAFKFVVVIVDKSTSVSASTLVTFTVPFPVIA